MNNYGTNTKGISSDNLDGKRKEIIITKKTIIML